VHKTGAIPDMGSCANLDISNVDQYPFPHEDAVQIEFRNFLNFNFG